MRLTIVAIGKLKDGGERVIVDRYLARMGEAKGQGLGPVAERELAESRLRTAQERRADEARKLLKAADGADLLLVLDERGQQLASDAFARWLGQRRDASVRHMAVLIGGPDGHGEAVIAAADLRLSLGAMTLPHGLARALIAEQLYRASTILAGHPYHRA
jgi:23S rRNA (pseudouridine1915-N3)-methyltransferase